MPPIRKIFLFWMVGTSSILLIVAVLFLRKPDPADPAPCGCRREFWQGPRGARLPSPRGTRGAPRRAGVPGDEIAHRCARSSSATAMLAGVSHDFAHHPDPLQARTGADRRQSGNRWDAQGCRRDVRHAGGLPLVCAPATAASRRSRPTWRRRWRNCAAMPSANGHTANGGVSRTSGRDGEGRRRSKTLPRQPRVQCGAATPTRFPSPATAIIVI